MKKIFLGILFIGIYISSGLAKSHIYGKNPMDWKLFTKIEGKVTKFGGGVAFLGDKMKTGYKTKLLPLNKGAVVIRWIMEFREYYAICIKVNTDRGTRILRYTSLDEDKGKDNNYISFGLGSNSRKGEPIFVYRDLQRDLEKFELGNKILSILSFSVRGGGEIMGLRTTTTSFSDKDEVIFEDGVNLSLPTLSPYWSIFTDTKGTISNIKSKYGEHTIKLSGKGMKTGYMISLRTLNEDFQTVGWDMKYSEDYAIYFLVNTTHGVKYLRYSALNNDEGEEGRYISFALGSQSKNGKWHSYRRNLQKDLNRFEPYNTILSINAFMIRGSGEVDNIRVIKNNSLMGSIKKSKRKKSQIKRINL